MTIQRRDLCPAMKQDERKMIDAIGVIAAVVGEARDFIIAPITNKPRVISAVTVFAVASRAVWHHCKMYR